MINCKALQPPILRTQWISFSGDRFISSKIEQKNVFLFAKEKYVGHPILQCWVVPKKGQYMASGGDRNGTCYIFNKGHKTQHSFLGQQHILYTR